jgi:hypothetical protein
MSWQAAIRNFAHRLRTMEKNRFGAVNRFGQIEPDARKSPCCGISPQM